MKKYLSLVFLFFLSVKIFAQGSFYTTVQAGPSLTFSNFETSPGYSYFSNYKVTASKLTSVFGAGVGYTFPDQMLKAETGIYKTFPHILLNLDEWKQPYPQRGEARVHIWYQTWQVPVRLKFRVWQPSDRFNLRVVTGGVVAFTQNTFKMKGDVMNVGFTGKGLQGNFAFQTNDSAPRDRTFGIQEDSGWGLQSNFMVETGLEASYRISENLDGLISVVFLNGLQTRRSADIYATQPDWDSGLPVTWLASRNTTDGNALNLTLGVAYSFSKKKN